MTITFRREGKRHESEHQGNKQPDSLDARGSRPVAPGNGRGHGTYGRRVRGAESGEEDLSFTFLYKCANVFGVDVIELLTGESPHLRGYSLVRAGEGLSIKRHAGFEYLHKAPHLGNKLAEPFLVTIPYVEEDQDKPIHLSYHKGQELDYIISGHLRFSYEGHAEDCGPGDVLMYDSARGHGLLALDGEPVVLLAVVIEPSDKQVI